MKFLSYGKDGGDKSNVWGWWLVEIKSLFSIVFLCFEKGSREAYHSHAFNAVTWFISGDVDEHHKDGRVLKWKPSFIPKYTPRSTFHKVYCNERTYALSLRGPWVDKWQEYSGKSKKTTTLTHGRVECL